MTRKAASVAIEKPPIATRAATEAATSSRAAIAALASDLAVPVPSGAHDLQDLLIRRLDEAPPIKWSMRATIGFVILTCGGFWAGVFLAVRLLIH
jgi:hypothetical protein